ncbi:hypothetical protein TNCV_3144021 [Trichonephila clavipes]|nr:hypothetical protein TNCV_3144021 [Trichonephila clavipes]
MKILARNIKYYTITIENIKANMRSLKLHGLNDEDCHIMKEHLQRLDNYTALNALTVSEFSSLPSCDNPACAEHHTPLNTPTKNNDNESPTLPKTASLKRKDNESEFFPHPTVNFLKTKILHWLLIKILKSISPTNSTPSKFMTLKSIP